jgi:hypothetical protein
MLGTPNKLPMAGYYREPASPCPVMSPAAMNLQRIHEAFKSGAITPEKKAELKEQLIGSASKGYFGDQRNYQRQIFNINLKSHKGIFFNQSKSSPALYKSPAQQRFRQQDHSYSPMPSMYQQDYRSPEPSEGRKTSNIIS